MLPVENNPLTILKDPLSVALIVVVLSAAKIETVYGFGVAVIALLLLFAHLSSSQTAGSD